MASLSHFICLEGGRFGIFRPFWTVLRPHRVVSSCVVSSSAGGVCSVPLLPLPSSPCCRRCYPPELCPLCFNVSTYNFPSSSSIWDSPSRIMFTTRPTIQRTNTCLFLKKYTFMFWFRNYKYI